MNRREVLTGIALAGVAAAVPVAAIAKSQPDRAAWDRAYAEWRMVADRFDALADSFDEVENDWGEAEGPRVDRYFDDYGLNTQMERGHVEAFLAMYNTRQRLTGGERIDVSQTADEFEAYRNRSADLRKSFKVQEHWDRLVEYRPTFHEARDRIMEVPAPDVQALLVKIEIASTSLDDEHAEAMRTDARRLLSDWRAA